MTTFQADVAETHFIDGPTVGSRGVVATRLSVGVTRWDSPLGRLRLATGMCE